MTGRGPTDILTELDSGRKMAGVGSIARTRRVSLTSRLLGAGALASVLPTLLTPLQAGVVLVHSHCDGRTHLHRLDTADLRDWQVGYDQQSPCCDSGEDHGAPSPGDDGNADCEHNQPPIVVAKSPFWAARARGVSAAHLAKVSYSAVPDVAASGRLAEHGLGSSVAATTDPAHVPRDATATLLLRNHALLL